MKSLCRSVNSLAFLTLCAFVLSSCTKIITGKRKDGLFGGLSVSGSPVDCSLDAPAQQAWRNTVNSFDFDWHCTHANPQMDLIYSCSLDGGNSWSDCGSSLQGLSQTQPTSSVSSLEEGPSYQLIVRGVDTEGQQDLTIPYIFQIDLTPPVIQNLTVSDLQHNAFTVLISGDDPLAGNPQIRSGAKEYRCYLGSNPPSDIATWSLCTESAHPSPSFSASGLNPNTDYELHVASIDNAGNKGLKESISLRTLAVPAGNGLCNVSTNLAQTNNSMLPFSLACSNPDSEAVYCKVSPTPNQWVVCNPGNSAQPGSYTTPSLPDGVYTLSARVGPDTQNPVSASTPVHVDTQKPTVSITDIHTDVSTANFDFVGQDGSGVGIKDYSCRLENLTATSVLQDHSWGNCLLSKAYNSGSILPNNQYKFCVKTRDKLDQFSDPDVCHTWTAPDTKAPQCVVLTPFNDQWYRSTTQDVRFACYATENGATITSQTCKLMEGSNVIYSGACNDVNEHSFGNLEHGKRYEFEVSATDSFGKTTLVPAKTRWRVDTVVPDVSVVSVSNLSEPVLRIPLSASDDDSGIDPNSFQCTLNGQSYPSVCGPSSFDVAAALLDPSVCYTPEVSARDRAGNSVSYSHPNCFNPPAPSTEPQLICQASPDTNFPMFPLYTNADSTSIAISCDVGSTPHCSINGQQWEACDTAVRHTFDNPDQYEGSVMVCVRAVSSTNVQGPSDCLSYNLDNRGPVVLVSNPNYDKDHNLTVSYTAFAGGSPLDANSCRCSLEEDGQEIRSFSDGVCASPTVLGDIAKKPGSTYELSVQCSDIAGNDSNVHTTSWRNAAFGDWTECKLDCEPTHPDYGTRWRECEVSATGGGIDYCAVEARRESCIACSQCACTSKDVCFNKCSNGATNPDDCDQCPLGMTMVNGQCEFGNGCSDVFSPVCGKDGNSYSNECQAQAAGVEVDYPRICGDTGGPGGGGGGGGGYSCSNGATNWPDCYQCKDGETFLNGACVPEADTCQGAEIRVNGACVAPCMNGAQNPGTCDQCPTGFTLDSNLQCVHSCADDEVAVAGQCYKPDVSGVCKPTISCNTAETGTWSGGGGGSQTIGSGRSVSSCGGGSSWSCPSVGSDGTANFRLAASSGCGSGGGMLTVQPAAKPGDSYSTGEKSSSYLNSGYSGWNQSANHVRTFTAPGVYNVQFTSNTYWYRATVNNKFEVAFNNPACELNNVCEGGEANYPDCDTCPVGQFMLNGKCASTCDNGADNAPSCNVCPEGRMLVDGVCKANFACSNGIITGNGNGRSAENAAPNCAYIKKVVDTQAIDGIYWIDPDGAADKWKAFRAYCDMTTDGGGWTLVSKSKYSAQGPEKIEITGDASLTGTYDPWSGVAIRDNTYVDRDEFTAPSASSSFPYGYNGDALLTAVDDLDSSAPKERFAIMHRELIDDLRTNCYMGSGDIGNARSLSVIRQVQNTAKAFVQSPKRFNPIQTKCLSAAAKCDGTDQSGCAQDFITTVYDSYNSDAHAVNDLRAIKNFTRACSSAWENGTGSYYSANLGWMSGDSSKSSSTSFYYNYSNTTSGPVSESSVNAATHSYCNGSTCPLTSVWVK